MPDTDLKYQLQQISPHCYLLSFLPEKKGGLITSVLLIAGKEHFFVVDTGYGSECMEIVKKFHAASFADKFIIVFNSHSHWDHVWGNNVFKNHPRIAHKLCAERIAEHDAECQQNYASFIKGSAETCLPDLLIDSEITFAEEGVRFFYSPGHTIDSCSVWVAADRLLFAADNLEKPLPYLENADTATYLKTLLDYKNLQPAVIATSHSGVITTELLDNTIDYLQNFNNASDKYKKDSPEWQIHQVNLQTIKDSEQS